mmetsp:Transcript_3464/g.6500  ORF Transcript_3464/g.6500 Transcript_3464/m.6500 type:complete len:92 (+) Transcript_3464:609-884(+)
MLPKWSRENRALDGTSCEYPRTTVMCANANRSQSIKSSVATSYLDPVARLFVRYVSKTMDGTGTRLFITRTAGFAHIALESVQPVLSVTLT